MTESVWTEERTELLRQRWADGVSASSIAAELGDVSRNSVLGKVHRLGLSLRRVLAPRRAATHDKIKRPRRALSADDIPIEQRKTLLELTNETCRWPYGNPGDSEFFFCGAEDADFAARRPYCRFHSAVACGRIRAPTLVPEKVAA